MPVPHSNLKQYTTIVSIKVSNELAFPECETLFAVFLKSNETIYLFFKLESAGSSETALFKGA